jgi:HEAT repeat protein
MSMRFIALLSLFAAISLFAEDARVYEGLTATDWIVRLQKLDFRKIKDAEAGQTEAERAPFTEFERIRHALGVLGKDSLKPLADMLKGTESGDGRLLISTIFYELKNEPKEQFLPALLELLKDPHFSVRRLAIEMLCQEAYVDDPKAEAAVKGMMADRDLAVVEAAEQGLTRIAEIRAQRVQPDVAPPKEIKAAPPKENLDVQF